VTTQSVIPLQCLKHSTLLLSDLRQVGDFFPGSPVSSTNKTDCNDIAEMLLKVALNTINP
jgi:hypothetical protein